MNLRDPDIRLKNLRSAFVSVAEELAQATASDGSEGALEHHLGRISHIAASAVMTVRGQLSDVVSSRPMFVRCPVCEKFHSPGHCK